jgi:hypothetical protein
MQGVLQAADAVHKVVHRPLGGPGQNSGEKIEKDRSAQR